MSTAITDALKNKPPERAARRKKRSMTKSLGKEVLLKYAGYDTGVVPKCRSGKLPV
jgi:hypothetical protein